MLWLLASLLAVGCGRAGPASPAQPPPSRGPLDGLVVLVDPGHGGIDGGATRFGVLEKDVTLQVALRLRPELRQRGADVHLTRTTDTEAPDGARMNVRGDWIRARADMAATVGANLFVAIHADVNPGRARGPSVLYNKDSALAAPLVAALKASLARATGQHVRVRPTNALILRLLDRMPAVLVEVGFLSDPHEVRLLVDPGYQQRLAAAVAGGIEAYWRQARGEGAAVRPVPWPSGAAAFRPPPAAWPGSGPAGPRCAAPPRGRPEGAAPPPARRAPRDRGAGCPAGST
jgi:N-acetylmuramoyl-L-alanine amidase